MDIQSDQPIEKKIQTITEKQTHQENYKQTQQIACKVLNKITNLFDIYIRHTSQEEITVTEICFKVIQHMFKIFSQSGQVDLSQTKSLQQVYYCNKIIEVLESKLVEHLTKTSITQAADGEITYSIKENKRLFLIRIRKLLNDSLKFCSQISEFLQLQDADKEFQKKDFSLQSKTQAIELLIQKVKNVKKIYLQEKKGWESQRKDFISKIQEQKERYQNLKNKRDQILEDMNQIEELIELNQIEAVKDIIQKNNRYSQSFYRPEPLSKIQQREIMVEVQQCRQLLSCERSSNENEIPQVRKQEMVLACKQNEALKVKIQQLKKELYRAACTISFLNKVWKKGRIRDLEKKKNLSTAGDERKGVFVESLEKKQNNCSLQRKLEAKKTPILEQLQKHFQGVGLKSFY